MTKCLLFKCLTMKFSNQHHQGSHLSTFAHTKGHANSCRGALPCLQRLMFNAKLFIFLVAHGANERSRGLLSIPGDGKQGAAF